MTRVAGKKKRKKSMNIIKNVIKKNMNIINFLSLLKRKFNVKGGKENEPQENEQKNALGL